jgi:tetratricopeptide (TPR) repeat protein
MNTLTDEARWERITALFDRLLSGVDLAAVLASEPDAEIRRAAEDLWVHHMDASRDDFLGAGPEFTVLPVFQPGQTLLGRFRIERMLGQGGMGEVYLAQDCRMEELVALKTIARLLAPSPSIRQRIVAEVQSARRVTHPNVCRIHELFDDGAVVFFTMEYLEGRLLSEVLEAPVNRREALLLTLQLAQGLYAAHQTGVVHGDLKPANIMVVRDQALRGVLMDFGLARAVGKVAPSLDRGVSVRAGTADFMAPELHAGGAPTVRSDIFAFGKIGRLLLPEERIWDECTNPQPERRPDSLALVLRRFEPGTSRRGWLALAAGATVAAAAYTAWREKSGGVLIPAGARLMVNGFREAAASMASARLARSLLLTVLRQSPRIHTVADEDLLPAMARLQPGVHFPLAGVALETMLQRMRADFWIEADIRRSSERYSFRLQLLRAPENKVVAETFFGDLPGVVALAQEAGLWIRERSGESPRSLAANPVAVDTYTSRVPEALQKYFEAMEHYAAAEMDLAIPLLQEAVRLDPSFAQAHSMLGMTLNPLGRYEQAYEEVERAKQLAGHLPERERNAIEGNYYTLTEDSVLTLQNAFRNIDYYPDEPRAYRSLARTLCRTGAAGDSIQYSRKALELSSGEELQRSELINNLCEAGRFEEALTEYEFASKAGIRNPWLYGSGGLAYLGLGRYQEAQAAYENEPSGNFRTIDLQRVAVLAGNLDSAMAATREARFAVNNTLEKHRVNETLCGLYYVTDQPALAVPLVREMADLPVYPQMARRLDSTAFWAARLGDRTALATARERLSQIARRWPSSFTSGLEHHALGLEAWLAGSFQGAESSLLTASGAAFSIWTLLDLANLYLEFSKPAIAENYFQRFDDHRGTLLSFWFTGTIVFGWLRRAMAAQARNDRAAAQAFSRKVLDHWSGKNPRLRMVQAAAIIHQTNSSL